MSTPTPLAYRYTTIEFNSLPSWARDTILDLEHQASQAPAMLEALRGMLDSGDHGAACLKARALLAQIEKG